MTAPRIRIGNLTAARNRAAEHDLVRRQSATGALSPEAVGGEVSAASCCTRRFMANRARSWPPTSRSSARRRHRWAPSTARAKDPALAAAQKRYDGVVDLDQWGDTVFAVGAKGRAAILNDQIR